MSSEETPKALRTGVKLMGITSLPDEESRALEATLRRVADDIVSLAECAHDPTMPGAVRYQRILDLEPSSNHAGELLAFAAKEAGSLPDGPFREEAVKHHKEALGLRQRLDGAFHSHRDTKDVAAAGAICAILLAILEKCMDILGTSDRSLVARLTDLCSYAKSLILELNDRFVVGREGWDSRLREAGSSKRDLIEALNRFSPVMITLTQSLMRRQAVIPGRIPKEALGGLIAVLREQTPKLLDAVQGNGDSGCVPRLTGALDEAAEVIKAVPQFSARLEIELITTNLDVAAGKLRDALVTGNVALVSPAARMMATEVEEILKHCVAIGLPAEEACVVRQALAQVIIAAKEAIATPGQESIMRFEAAMQHLDALVKQLPSKSQAVIREESFDLLTAARRLVSEGMTALVRELEAKN